MLNNGDYESSMLGQSAHEFGLILFQLDWKKKIGTR